jgi:hypothetical protein
MRISGAFGHQKFESNCLKVSIGRADRYLPEYPSEKPFNKTHHFIESSGDDLQSHHLLPSASFTPRA